jgi:hypothetical protein
MCIKYPHLPPSLGLGISVIFGLAENEIIGKVSNVIEARCL